jgi:NADH pyrophosphatase NudC (nudix superfamily)
MKVEQVFRQYEDDANIKYKSPVCCPECGECYNSHDKLENQIVCHGCGEIVYLNPVPAVSVLVAEGDKFLLGKRSASSFEGGKWSLPCGYIELNEDFLTAGRREVKEETGLDVEIQSIISVMTNYFLDKQTLVVVLLAKPDGDGRLRNTDGEMTELRWFSSEEDFPEMAFKADTHIIKRYFTDRFEGLPVDTGFSRTVK